MQSIVNSCCCQASKQTDSRDWGPIFSVPIPENGNCLLYVDVVHGLPRFVGYDSCLVVTSYLGCSQVVGESYYPSIPPCPHPAWYGTNKARMRRTSYPWGWFSPGLPPPNEHPTCGSPQHAGPGEQVLSLQNSEVRPFTRDPLCPNLPGAVGPHHADGWAWSICAMTCSGPFSGLQFLCAY